MKKYILMKKDIPVALFHFEDKILKQFDIFNFNLLPIGFVNPTLPFNAGFRNIITCLDNWLKTRTIPITRFGYPEIKTRLGLYDTSNLLITNYGLSLNDDYWFKPEDDNKTWAMVNFFENEYSEEFGEFLFDPKQERTEINLISPDFTTNGDNLKRWQQFDDMSSILVKSNPENEQIACNEVFASKIAKRLNLEHIEYGLLKQHVNIYAGSYQGFNKVMNYYNDVEVLCSACKNYCTPNLSYVPANTYIKSLKISTMKNLYDDMTSNPVIKSKIDDMIILDFLINNIDRHTNNFGFLVNENNIIVDLFPIFDCGNSMDYNDRFGKDKKDYSKMFNKPYVQLLDLVSDTSKYDLTALNKIDDLFYKIYNESNLTQQEKESILRLFKMRLNDLKQFLYRKNM